MTLVEKVTKTILPAFDHIPDKDYRLTIATCWARAAIEAMRDITPDIDDMHPPFVNKREFHESWRAMIDMALKPRAQPRSGK